MKEHSTLTCKTCNILCTCLIGAFHMHLLPLSTPSVRDPEELAAIELQIKEFGQTPKQLFTKPHPRKTVVSKVRH